MDRIPGYRPRILYEEPHCDGLGSSIFNCQWNTMQLGSGVCDYHRDIGIQCLPLHDQPIANWRGIKFIYAPVFKSLAEDNTIYTSLSKSELKHVDIIKAGSGKNRLTTAAIEVIGIPPVIDHVSVDHSAFTGVNITKPEGAFSIKHLSVKRSKGIGVFINSSYGLAHLENANIRENGDDGVKYVAHDLKPEDIRSRTSIFDFCTLPITSSQTYPVSILVSQDFYATNQKECGKYFITRPGYVLNVMFDHFSTNRNESARVDVYDGSSASDRLLTSFLVRNYTRHQTVTSFRGRIYLQFTAEPRSYDFNVTNSLIEDNGGRGVATDNIRSSVHVHGSTISNNGHIAGIHVTSGAADVNVTSSKINFNVGDGINITYYGGNRNISHSSIASNQGYGFAVWLNETTNLDRKEYLAINQSTTIQYSQIFNNLETGVRHGNFCGEIFINITGTHFNGSFGNDIDIQSCWFPIKDGNKKMHLQIGHNIIENSKRIGFLMYPVLNVKGRIEYNHFVRGSKGSIYIGNPQWDEFNSLPAHFVIQNNYFSKNTGQFVVSLGLSTYTDREIQSILFTRNFVRQNRITEPFGGIDDGTEGVQGSGRLKPRSKVAAVLVISSSNIDIYRNIIANLESKYEIGSQLLTKVKLFHRNHRYNLAKIEYIPFLLHNTNPGTNTVISLPMFIPKFISEGSNLIGGEVDGEEIIPTGTYFVNKDINVRPGGKLKLQPGVVLYFDPSVGMMVAGKLEAKGRHPDDILFTLKKEPVMGEGNATTFDEMADMELLESQTEVVENNPGIDTEPEVHVRLVGSNIGKNEGRLQVYVNKRWGTVCDYGWTITNAALFVTVEKAGLFDYATNALRPAIQMDFARHNLEMLELLRTFMMGLFTMNGGNGISLKQLGLRVHGSIIKANQGAGIFHDPVISSLEQKELAGWFKIPKDFNSYDSNYSPLIIPKDTPSDISLGSWETKFIVTEKHYGDQNLTKTIKINCSPGYVIGIQLLNPIVRNSTEEIVIYDSQDGNLNSDIWILSRDLSTFPVASSGYGIILKYSSGNKAFGGTVLMVSTLLAPEQNIPKRIVKATPPTLYVQHTKILRNTRGISAYYYNRYYGDINELYLRKSNESIKLYNVEVSHNQHEAMLVRAPFWDVHVSNLSEVTIHLNNSHIYNNGEGVKQISRDLRSSNNLFHYVIQGTIFETIDLVALIVFVGNTTWRQNRNFKFLVRGHFARVNLTTNIFVDNRCENGLIALDGMEKQIRYEFNKITNNNCKYIMEFRADSLSEILGEVHALVAFNDIQGNFYNKSAALMMSERMRFLRTYSKQPTTTIRLNGNQNVRVFRNLFIDNTLEYELVAGVRSARLNNKLIASENWWGSTDSSKIEKRIFDFDDWNNYAEVKFRPFLIENSFDSSISVGAEDQVLRKDRMEDIIIQQEGGKVYQDITLRFRKEPYIFTRDLTVMPNVTLKIDHGVKMQFASDIGILVLGSLRAIGYKESPIVMTSIENKNKAEEFRNDKHEGFLEFFNHTTLQWVPICDHRFTERNAQVVCRELGYDPLDVYYSFDHRLEFHTNSLTRIWSWVQPLECRGDETRFEFCPERLNGQLYGRHHECRWDDKFVFVSCTGTPEEKPYWGGIRFAYPGFESSLMEHFHDSNQGNRYRKKESNLEFVEIHNAGILHGEKSPAIQSISKNPKIESVTIDNAAYHGINLIAPTESVDLKFLNISNTLGQGVNVISLTGEGRESDESSFTPLKSLDLPYSLYSFIDICDPSKVITVEERVILYYKYDNNPVNCVKIFNSNFWVKPVGFRLLQSNLFNHSKEYGRTDSIKLYDGDIYNVTSFFKTRGPILSVRLIASGASSNHGFFAEVVTVPISSIGFNRDAQHNISYSEISSTVKGAISYSTAGEVSPILTMTSNRFQRNCRQLYGNFSTCEAAINIDAQNMQYLYFMNNLVQNNQGGLLIRADSRGSATSLQARINSNLFTHNKNRPSIKMEGRQSSPYQQTVIFKNYISQNKAGYSNVIVLKQVVSNFTYNYVHGNVGGRILEISGFEKVRLPIYQTTSNNGFYNNYATDWRGKATIIAGTAGQKFDFEKYLNSTLEIWKTKIDARHNYWSYNETISVASRVMDKYDNPQLLEVQIQPFYMNNATILDGKCPPGWTQVFDTCYMYVGSPMSFREAREFCRSDNASMPFIRTDSHYSLWKYLESQMTHMRFPEKVWVQDYNHIDTCTSFIYRSVEVEDCNKRMGFLCEIDPL
uniref:SRCR domain-containing protein n=1 Tax=Megaselia scalaris TaxID=36166 RepID=T1GGG9_MEGSC